MALVQSWVCMLCFVSGEKQPLRLGKWETPTSGWRVPKRRCQALWARVLVKPFPLALLGPSDGPHGDCVPQSLGLEDLRACWGTPGSEDSGR